MQIGSFKSVNGTLLGHIATSEINLARLGLKPVQSNHERAPAFEVMAMNPARRWVQIGALWEATANSTGEVFYQGQIDDPSFKSALPIALFGSEEDGFNVAWNRRRPRKDSFNDSDDDASGPADAPENNGGFGFGAQEPETRQPARRSRKKADSFEGNTDQTGTLNQPIDDEIPF
ncbi:DUF736 domain-containing protein [Sphingomonas oryzagri]